MRLLWWEKKRCFVLLPRLSAVLSVFALYCDLIKAIKWAFSRNTLLTDPWEIPDLQCNTPPLPTSLETSNHEVSPHLFWFPVERCLQNSEKAVHGMVWILSGPGYVGHHMKSYMKYTLKNSPWSCTVMQIWSFSVMKFMLKCLRSCPNKIIESGRVVIYAAHYTCSNVDLNLILVAARTSGFIFQIIDSLMASRGVHLTWRDCIPKR